MGKFLGDWAGYLHLLTLLSAVYGFGTKKISKCSSESFLQDTSHCDIHMKAKSREIQECEFWKQLARVPTHPYCASCSSECA